MTDIYEGGHRYSAYGAVCLDEKGNYYVYLRREIPQFGMSTDRADRIEIDADKRDNRIRLYVRDGNDDMEAFAYLTKNEAGELMEALENHMGGLHG